jgi:hypothetical protein
MTKPHRNASFAAKSHGRYHASLADGMDFDGCEAEVKSGHAVFLRTSSMRGHC